MVLNLAYYSDSYEQKISVEKKDIKCINIWKFSTLKVGKVYIYKLEWMLQMPLIQLIQRCKIRMQMQCKVPQIKHRVLWHKIRLSVPQIRIRFKPLQFKSLQVRFQLKVQHRLFKMYLSNQYNKWSLMQLAPTGIVMLAPQIIYQNWVGKKPEFSGKPEEDAESHLLSTRDWMEAHNFPEGEKVRHFCIMLIGEARLWYELLAPLDDDWPTLQNKFRWQYSKIGNTPEQLFHAWRTFKFDENMGTIDSYVLRMSQVVAMLNYGEMQILENCKNTLPYRLYSTLINVNNLRDAIGLAKRVLTKEKLDRQLTGQSSTPFMKATSNDNHSPQNHHKKGVTFDVMETLERNSDCLDRLNLLVSDMKMTMDRKQFPYKPKIYQGRSRNQNVN